MRYFAIDTLDFLVLNHLPSLWRKTQDRPGSKEAPSDSDHLVCLHHIGFGDAGVRHHNLRQQIETDHMPQRAFAGTLKVEDVVTGASKGT